MKIKPEFYALVSQCAEHGMSAPQIGEALGYTPQRVRQVMAELGLQQRRFASALAAIQTMPPELRARIAALRMRRDCKNETDVGTAATVQHLRAAEEQPR